MPCWRDCCSLKAVNTSVLDGMNLENDQTRIVVGRSSLAWVKTHVTVEHTAQPVQGTTTRLEGSSGAHHDLSPNCTDGCTVKQKHRPVRVHTKIRSCDFGPQGSIWP